MQSITLNGVEIKYHGPRRVVFWASDWSRVWDLVAAGLLSRRWLGAATFGDCEFTVNS